MVPLLKTKLQESKQEKMCSYEDCITAFGYIPDKFNKGFMEKGCFLFQKQLSSYQ